MVKLNYGMRMITLITDEIKRFLEFREKLIRIIDGSYSIFVDEYDSTHVDIKPDRVADEIIDLIAKYEGKNEKV